MIVTQLAIAAAALLLIVALLQHWRITARTRRLGGFYVVPAATPDTQHLRPRATRGARG